MPSESLINLPEFPPACFNHFTVVCLPFRTQMSFSSGSLCEILSPNVLWFCLSYDPGVDFRLHISNSIHQALFRSLPRLLLYRPWTHSLLAVFTVLFYPCTHSTQTGTRVFYWCSTGPIIYATVQSSRRLPDVSLLVASIFFFNLNKPLISGNTTLGQQRWQWRDRYSPVWFYIKSKISFSDIDDSAAGVTLVSWFVGTFPSFCLDFFSRLFLSDSSTSGSILQRSVSFKIHSLSTIVLCEQPIQEHIQKNHWQGAADPNGNIGPQKLTPFLVQK